MGVGRGIFFGVSVGPGDPELLTRKACRVLEACPVIGAAQTARGEQLALSIARRAVDLTGKEILSLPFSMARDLAVRQAAWRRAAAMVRQVLDRGQDVAMVVLGDVSIYSTYCYLMELLREEGYETEMIPGVASFSAVAARLGVSLTTMEEPLHILPASQQAQWEGLTLPGTKVLMKSGRSLKDLVEKLAETGQLEQAVLVANCGLDQEMVCTDLRALPEGAGYYAGSLVNPVLLGLCSAQCRIFNSAEMTLEQVLSTMEQAEREQKQTVRLHTGDPCLYGAIQEQMDALKKRGIPYTLTPGVSSFCGAAAAVEGEYTLPGISQTVIITRMAGRTPVPERENIASLAEHGATMVIFLSASLLDGLQEALLQGAYTQQTPAALVYKATWPEEKVVRCPLGELAQAGRDHGISKTALVLVGDFLSGDYTRSRLYAPDFSTEFRRASE